MARKDRPDGDAGAAQGASVRAALEERVAGGGPVVVLTGAGVSAESGIPTFRGPEGYWTVGSEVYHPEELATRAAFTAVPDEVWAWYLHRRRVCRAAAPNPAHLALARAGRALGSRLTLVTQNVDGLHLRAGSPPEATYEVHGNIDFMRCAGPHGRERIPLPDREPALAALTCPQCGGRTRPHVLWFDEYYDEELYRFESSLRAAAAAAVLITAGSSGATNLPSQMVQAAAAAGALLVDINPEDGPFARAARRSGGAWLRGTAGALLPQVMAILTGEQDAAGGEP